MDDGLVITIDGPAASGKGTLAKHLSAELQFFLLDSGLLYRIVAFEALRQGLDLHQPNGIVEMVATRLVFKVNSVDVKPVDHEEPTEVHIFKYVGLEDSVRVGDVNVNLQLRSHELGTQASIVAAIPKLRSLLIPIQRAQARSEGLVADGRDMGTVVFPDAQVKFYLDASIEERARRRALELELRGERVDIKQIEKDLQERDQSDFEREVAPLIPAKDAIHIDATKLNIEEMVKTARQHIHAKVGI